MDEIDLDDVILELSEAGIVKNFTVDDEGNVDRYDIDWDLFRQLHPTMAEFFWEAHLEEVGQVISELADEGFIEMVVVENEDGTIEEGYRVPDDIRKELENG
jgi:hypothetical protein